MLNIYTVTYNRPNNPNVSKYQNEVRGIATKIIRGETEAKAFAKTVETIAVRNYIGKRVEF